MRKYSRNNRAISGHLDDELVMMDIEKGSYFALNPVATRIWELLENPVSLDDLCQQLQEEYEVDQALCRRETEECLAEMIKLGLLFEIVEQ